MIEPRIAGSLRASREIPRVLLSGGREKLQQSVTVAFQNGNEIHFPA
jgi:hypothetical protein